VLRVIGRLNIGGPSIQAITLSERLTELGYETTLVRGHEEPDEGNMNYLARNRGVPPILVRWMRRNPGWRDLPALYSLARIMREQQPDIVHTHAAKAGTLGRLAALIAFPQRSSRPILIHTYHGHSLTGYFSSATAGTYRRIEQLLGRFTDCLIAVSDEVRDELVELGIAPSRKFEVVPLGLDLAPFTINGATRQSMREAMREELGIPPRSRVVTLVARLVPIKRVDRFLQVAQELSGHEDVHFLIVGDGELRESLEQSPEARALGDRLTWAGFRRDIPAVVFTSDVIVQTSDNEGTPVSLIEAQAAGVPVVSTRVGGAPTVIQDGATGFVTPRDPPQAMAFTIDMMLKSEELRTKMGERARERTLQMFSLDRLTADIDDVYRWQLDARRRLIESTAHRARHTELLQSSHQIVPEPLAGTGPEPPSPQRVPAS
jgi:glycosyltransferase involved in cell wall biosynthesis